jgi:8-amino-7-oxononanoate synthase
MEDFPHMLAKKLAEREVVNALRTLEPSIGEVDFSSNDYLGLAGDEGIYSWAGKLMSGTAVPRNGATGSRLLSGNHSLYKTLEDLLEKLYETPALVFNSGYDANTGFFSSVPQRGDLVLYDEFVHASIRDGIRMGLAKSYRFSHNNLGDLQTLLRRKERREGPTEIYVVTESVFSMDGDSPDLKALLGLCREYRCRLVVDEAHALGVKGSGAEGMMQQMGLHRETFARILTFGKAIGAHGAAIVGNSMLKAYLLNFARSFIYTTAMPPHSIATLLAAYHFMATENGRKRQVELRKNIDFFRQTVIALRLEKYFTEGQSAIHCCLLPGNTQVRQASGHLRQNGFDVRPILSPTVAEGKERLRFCLHSYNTREEIQQVLEQLQLLLD